MKKKVITLLTMVLVITILAGCSMQRESLIEKIDKEETSSWSIGNSVF